MCAREGIWGSRVLGALPLKYQVVVIRGAEAGDARGEDLTSRQLSRNCSSTSS
jgi:hypothetical protein